MKGIFCSTSRSLSRSMSQSAWARLTGAWVVMATLGLALVPAAHAAQTKLDQLRQLDGSWTDAGLEVKLMTDDGSDVVALDEPVRYQLTAQQGGVCYLVHVDAQDSATLIRPQDCANLSEGQSSYFPAAGDLTAAAPWGEESVFAFMLTENLPAAEELLAGSQGLVPLQSQAQLDAVLGALRTASESGQLAVAQTQYDVLQYRTRGIIKAVKSARTQEEKEPAKAVSFAVQSINFEFGSDELTEAGVRQLDQFGMALSDPELASTRLQVAGHTDDQGDELYNLDLSQRRAASVGAYLKQNFQISEDRIEVVGFGESKPVIDDDSLEARAQNRRVEMVLID